MSGTGRSGGSDAGEVVHALGEAASQIGNLVNQMVEEQPEVALAAAVAAGFVAGGGLSSRLGAQMTNATVRATMGNLTTLIALDLLRRALDGGGKVGDTEHSIAQ